MLNYFRSLFDHLLISKSSLIKNGVTTCFRDICGLNVGYAEAAYDLEKVSIKAEWHLFRFMSYALILFFVGAQHEAYANNVCPPDLEDCVGPELGPFSYSTGYGGSASSAQGAAENYCDYWLDEPGALVSCDITYVAPFPDGDYVGSGSDYDIIPYVTWYLNEEGGQVYAGHIWEAMGVHYTMKYDHNGLITQNDAASILARGRSVVCPVGYKPNTNSPINAYCIPISGKPVIDRGPCVSDPIYAGSGNSQQRETDYQSGVLDFVRIYNSKVMDVINGEPMGKHWRHNYDRYLSIPSNGTGSAYAMRQNGDTNHFVLENGVAVDDPMISDRLEHTASGWTYITAADETELYDDTGRLASITNRIGQTQTLTYDNTGRLIQVSDDAGRTLTLTYDSEGRIASMTDPEERVYTYEYDGNSNLVKVIYPDTTTGDQTDNPSRTYHYEDTRFPQALTGITDENGNRYATWSYDVQGRAISSEHANGVDKTTLTYNADGTTTVTSPLGKQTTYHFVDIRGYRYVESVEGHPANYCAGANKSYQYDANGNVTSKTDWNGVTTTYTYDMTRNLELNRTEAVGTPQERTITTQWHPGYRLPVKITEPGKITEYTYDTQGHQLSKSTQGVQ